MRHWPLVVLIVSLLACNASAQFTGVQVTSVKEYPPEFDESRNIWQEVVENPGPKTIVALHTTFHCTPVGPTSGPTNKRVTGQSSGGIDALSVPFYMGAEVHEGIPPGLAAEIFAEDPSRCTGGVDAIIFADGQSEGDSNWVNYYRQEWVGIHQGIIESIPLIAKIANQKANLAEIEDAFRALREAIPEFPVNANGGFDRTKMGERTVYIDLELLLQSVRDSKAKPESAQDSQPCRDEVEAKGVSDKQAQETTSNLANGLLDVKADGKADEKAAPDSTQARSEDGAEGDGPMTAKQAAKFATYLGGTLQQWKTAVEHGLGYPSAK
jgi:hypothetical protein